MRINVAVLIILSMFLISVVDVYGFDRHSLELQRKLSDYIYAINSLYTWLSEMGIDRELLSNQSLVDVLSNKTLILNIIDKIYGNPIATLFLPGSLLRVLNYYGFGKQCIDEDDVAKILNTILLAVDNNDDFKKYRTILTKIVENIANLNSSKYDISDLAEVSKFIVELSAKSSVSQSISSEILTRIYILSLSIKSNRISRSIAEYIVNDTAYRYSLFIALFISDVIAKNSIEIVNEESYSGVDAKMIEGFAKIQRIDLDTLRKAVSLAIEYYRVVGYREEYIDIENIEKVIEIIISRNITTINSTTLNIVKASVSETREGESISKNMSSEVGSLAGEEYQKVFPEGVEELGYISEYPEYTEEQLAQGGIVSRPVEQTQRSITIAVESKHDVARIAKTLMSSGIVQKVLKHVNSYDIVGNSVDLYSKLDKSLNTYPQSRSQASISIPILQSIVVAFAIAFPLVLFLRARGVFKAKEYSGIGMGLVHGYAVHQVISSPWFKLFEDFWDTLLKIASRFDIKIRSSNTHREIGEMISEKIGESEKLKLINEAIMNYEIARFSQYRDSINMNEFEELLKRLKNMYGGGT